MASSTFIEQHAHQLDDLLTRQKDFYQSQQDALRYSMETTETLKAEVAALKNELASAESATKIAHDEVERAQESCKDELRSRKELEDRVRSKWTLALDEERMGRKDSERELATIQRELQQNMKESQKLKDLLAASEKAHAQSRRELQDARDHTKQMEAERKQQADHNQELLGIIKTFMATQQEQTRTDSTSFSDGSTKRSSTSKFSSLDNASPLSPTHHQERKQKPHPSSETKPRTLFPTTPNNATAVRPHTATSISHKSASLKQSHSVSPRKLDSSTKPRPEPPTRGSTFTVPIRIKDEELDPDLLSADSEGSLESLPVRRPTRRKPHEDEEYRDDSEGEDNDEMAIGFETNRRELYGSRPVRAFRDADNRTPLRPVVEIPRRQLVTPQKRKAEQHPHENHPRRLKR